jgi:hypothetical protein
MIITFRRVDQFNSELVNWLKLTNSVLKCKVIGQFDELVNSVSQAEQYKLKAELGDLLPCTTTISRLWRVGTGLYIDVDAKGGGWTTPLRATGAYVRRLFASATLSAGCA